MIIKSIRRGNFKQLGAYMMGEADNAGKNEECNFIASHGFGAYTAMPDIMREMYSRVAPRLEGSHGIKKPLEHISIRTRADDPLSPEQAIETLEALLEKSGYGGCSWVMTQHIKDGHEHYHAAVLRIDEGGKLPNPQMFPFCQNIALEKAEKFNLKAAKGMRLFANATADLNKLWTASDKQKPKHRLKAFIKAGFIPARGDKGQLVFVDRQGKPHSPHHIEAVQTAKMGVGEVAAAFGLDKGKFNNLPTFKDVSKDIWMRGWKPTLNRIVRRIGNVLRSTRYSRYGRYDIIERAFSVSAMSAWDALSQQRQSGKLLSPQASGNDVSGGNGMQPVRGTGGAGGVDFVLRQLEGVVGNLEAELQRMESATPRDSIAIANKKAEIQKAKMELAARRVFLAERAKRKAAATFQH